MAAPIVELPAVGSGGQWSRPGSTAAGTCQRVGQSASALSPSGLGSSWMDVAVRLGVVEQDGGDGAGGGFRVVAKACGEGVVEPEGGEAVHERPGGDAGERDVGSTAAGGDGADP